MNVMSIHTLIQQVSAICKKNHVQRLDLFGSFATGTATPTSDIDFVVYGCDRYYPGWKRIWSRLKRFGKSTCLTYDSIRNEYLLEDIKKYGKQIY